MSSTPPDEPAEGFEDSESDSEDEEAAGAVEQIEPQLERLPSDQRRTISATLETSHSGPLPSPRQLAQYETVLPGLAERIVRLTEREQEHRHEIVTFAVGRSARLRDRGQIFGMAALMLSLLFCTYLVYTGNAREAAIVAVGLVAAVVGIFVVGRKQDVKEIQAEHEAAD